MVPGKVLKHVSTISDISIRGSHSLNMTNNTKLDEKLEGVDNFRAWKYRVILILEEHDLQGYIKDEIKEPEGDEAKEKHKKYMVKDKRIIDDSIKDHLIPKLYSKNTPKD